MYQVSSITEISDLKVWFDSLNKHGYWVLYRGPEKKPSERVSAGTYESEETGWLALYNNLAMQIKSGGLFTVYVSSKETDSSGYTTRFSGNVPMNNISGNNSSIGSPFNQDSIQGMIEAQVNQKMSEYKKDRLIEDLQNELVEAKKGKRKKSLTGYMEEIGEVLEENPTLAGILTPFIHQLGSRFISNVDPQFANVAGTPAKRTTIVHEASQDVDQNSEEAQEEFSEAEINTLVDCVNRLAIHFDNPIDLISKFTNFVEENPEKAKMTISMIIK